MKKIFILFILLISMYSISYAHPIELKSNESLDVYFTPEDMTRVIVNLINSAKTDVKMLCYSFTSKPISDALIAAYKRGIKVTIIADHSLVNGYTKSYIGDCATAGIPVFIDTKYSIAHDKIIIIDNNIVITGSFNFTYAAQFKNSENIIVIHSSDVNLYTNRFNERMKTTTLFKQ